MRRSLGRHSDSREATAMARNPSTSTNDPLRITWGAVRGSITRPYRVTIPMIVLVSFVPFYLVIAGRARGSVVHAPELALDRLLPLTPMWALVYGALYAFLIVLPVFVIQQEELIRRTVWAYLTVWTVAYICFILYPTVAPRPDTVTGKRFAAWGLRFLYEADPPYNCFPSLHVAHSFVSALACWRVHRPLGVIAASGASLVAISTLFTKQHYVADLVAGILLAFAAYTVFLRGYSRANVPELDRRLAPVLALCVGGIVSLGVGCYWILFQLGFEL
jgi:membrane-associated phospholipid phosphatase